MDSSHFWDDNHFHLLFDDSPSPHVENIMEISPTPSMHIIFQYSPVLVCYSNDFVYMEGYTYLDPHDQCRYLEHHFQLVLQFIYLSLYFTWSSHDHLDMGPWFTMEVGLLQYDGFHFSMGP
jgi:hypothetical protein